MNGEFAFSKYWAEKEQYDKAHKMQLTTPIPAQAPLFNHSVLFKTIEDRNNMTESELRYFISNSFNAIMNNIFDPTVGDKYISAFREERFLDAFSDVISQIQWFESDVIVRINLIVYHYITSSTKKKEVIYRMLKIAEIINRNKIVYIKKFNMPEQLEKLIMVARYSDFNLDICVKRVNLILINSSQIAAILNINPDDEADEYAIDWLSKLLIELYKPEDWPMVLPYLMLDVLPATDEPWITPEVEALDSALNLAILNVLDKFIDDSNMLRNILVSYSEGYRILNSRKPYRFSFQNLSNEYPRINNTLKYLRDEEKIYVP